MRWCAGLAAVGWAIGAGFGAPSIDAAAAARRALSPEGLAPVANIVRQEITDRHVPGAVVLIGQDHTSVYRQAFGLRTTRPRVVPMTVDTVFDLASLTKVIATTTAVMQLVERGALDLDASASTYWPEFAVGGKGGITLRQLLTHYSGLRPDLNLSRRWTGYDTAMQLLVEERPLRTPGTQYVYSDENFEVLGEIVRRVSGTSLDRYCEENIFKPLGMRNTGFRPSLRQASRIAPTSSSRASLSASRLVNDPTAQRMGGIAGHAGLFSTADDLAVFATMLLDGGTYSGVRVLSPKSVAVMTAAASPPAGSHIRGLGWDLASPLDALSDDDAFPGSYGHTGFTGTMIWIDPASRSYVIILTNRTYPDGRGDAQALRKAILGSVASALQR